jgi:Holliday junction DNA helicase RuvA
MKVPGIGRKGAQRIVLELTDRLGAPSSGAPAAAPVAAGPAWRDRVVEALVGLGWSAKQAADAVEAVSGQDDDAGTADVPGTLRAALRHLGRSA